MRTTTALAYLFRPATPMRFGNMDVQNAFLNGISQWRGLHGANLKVLLTGRVPSKAFSLLSSAEAEYIAAFERSKEAVWLEISFLGLGVVPTIEKPINMYCDNTGAIAIANESGITKGARHFHAKVHYLREVIEFGDIKLEKVHTDDNLADPFTKALAFQRIRTLLGILECFQLVVSCKSVFISHLDNWDLYELSATPTPKWELLDYVSWTSSVTTRVIMEYLVKVSKRRAFWSLNEDILKITILKTNTPYPSRKIRRIRACTYQRPQMDKAQYAVSRETQYAVFKKYHFQGASLPVRLPYEEVNYEDPKASPIFHHSFLIPKNKFKGVTTRGGKITSEATRNKEINETRINKNEPPKFEQDVQEKPHYDGKSSSIHERTTQPLVKPQQSSVPFPNRVIKEKEEALLEEACTETTNERCSTVLLNELPSKEKDPRSFTTPCQVLEKHKEAEDLAADHLSRFENPHMEVLTKREIADKFSDKHLMVVPPNWTFEKRKRFFSQVKTYFWEEPYAFKLCADNIMRRCVAGSETLEILAHCHSGPTGGHHSANITVKKVYESRFYWPSVFKDANEYVRRCDACQRSGNISSRNKMPQNNIQVCKVFDVWGLDFMGPFPQSRGNKYILVAVDYMSKWVEAQALPTNDARVVVKFLRSLFARFRVPKALISDRGTHFCNSHLEKALQRYGVTHKLSTAYHPQSKKNKV
ncbi:reverse transcriptase domain-containing protein [Tanacetum coccineum]